MGSRKERQRLGGWHSSRRCWASQVLSYLSHSHPLSILPGHTRPHTQQREGGVGSRQLGARQGSPSVSCGPAPPGEEPGRPSRAERPGPQLGGWGQAYRAGSMGQR